MNQPFNESNLLNERYQSSYVQPNFFVRKEIPNTPYMNQQQRYQALCNYRSDMAGADSFTINRVNFDFLLNSYNTMLQMKDELNRLKSRKLAK